MFDLVPNLVAGSGNPLQAARGRYSGWFLDPQGQWVTGGRRVQQQYPVRCTRLHQDSDPCRRPLPHRRCTTHLHLIKRLRQSFFPSLLFTTYRESVVIVKKLDIYFLAEIYFLNSTQLVKAVENLFCIFRYVVVWTQGYWTDFIQIFTKTSTLAQNTCTKGYFETFQKLTLILAKNLYIFQKLQLLH